MDNIIFDTSKEYCLGDEMSMTRNCILDLLINNYITKDVVIYCGKDRNFLYENIFENIFTNHEDFTLETVKIKCLEKFGKEFTIISYLPHRVLVWPEVLWDEYGGYENILDKNICITNSSRYHSNNNIFNYHKINYYNSKNHSNEFKKLVTNINYLKVLPKFVNETFIVYHHRVKNDGLWNQNDNQLNRILKNQNNYNIVIFSQSDLDYLNCNQKVFFTKNLKEYASFIHSNNCLAVISVWSGGGQLASYCSNANTKLIMYFDKCQLKHSNGINNNLNKWINSENAFDFAQFTDVNRIFINENDLEEEFRI
jgi:hypothetical protein